VHRKPDAKALQPGIRVFGAEPAGADDAFRSKAAGALQGHDKARGHPRTVADGLKTTLGSNTWPIVRDKVERIFLVEEDAIVAATRLVWERMKLVIEPSAGTGVAVALSPAFQALEGITNVGVVLCGGNVSLDSLPWQK